MYLFMCVYNIYNFLFIYFRYCSCDAEIKLSFGDNNGITKSTVTYIKVS